jgi:photosystem II stability/assembly factor-like uncharacterized protein
MRGSHVHPELVYAGIFKDGLYRTDNAGETWTKVFDGLVRSVAADPGDDSVVYVGTEPIQLFRSDDRGARWEQLEGLGDLPEEVKQRWWFPVAPHIGHVLNIFIHPADTRIIYLCLEHGGIVRSLDRGETWADVSAGIDYLDIHMLGAVPGARDRYFVATAQGFYTSDDPAEGWERAQNGFTRDYFHDFVFLPAERANSDPTMLIATADGSPGRWNRPEGARAAVFRSKDRGASWHRVGKGIPDQLTDNVWAVTTSPSDSNRAFIGLGSAFSEAGSRPGDILETCDRGESWQPLGVNVPAVRTLWAAVD